MNQPFRPARPPLPAARTLAPARPALQAKPALPPAAKAAPATVANPVANPAANGAADEIIALAGRLIATMENEIALLEKMKVSEIADGQAEKDRVARSFEAKLKALAGEPALAAAIAPALKAELKATMEKFKLTMHANERTLRAARTANERVVKAIVDAAQEQSAPRHAYSAAGTLGGSAGSDRLAPPPMALDRRL